MSAVLIRSLSIQRNATNYWLAISIWIAVLAASLAAVTASFRERHHWRDAQDRPSAASERQRRRASRLVSPPADDPVSRRTTLIRSKRLFSGRSSTSTRGCRRQSALMRFVPQPILRMVGRPADRRRTPDEAAGATLADDHQRRLRPDLHVGRPRRHARGTGARPDPGRCGNGDADRRVVDAVEGHHGVSAAVRSRLPRQGHHGGEHRQGDRDL